MLLGTVLLWALNSTVTRYVLTHGFHPLAYATIRYGGRDGALLGFTYARERSFRIARRDVRLVLLAAACIFLNQICFVYSIDKTSASTVTLFLGMTPIFIGVLADGRRPRAHAARRSGRRRSSRSSASAFVALGLGWVLGTHRRRRARRR